MSFFSSFSLTISLYLLSMPFSIYLSIHLYIRYFIYQFMHLSIYIYIFMNVYLNTYLLGYTWWPWDRNLAGDVGPGVAWAAVQRTQVVHPNTRHNLMAELLHTVKGRVMISLRLYPRFVTFNQADCPRLLFPLFPTLIVISTGIVISRCMIGRAVASVLSLFTCIDGSDPSQGWQAINSFCPCSASSLEF